MGAGQEGTWIPEPGGQSVQTGQLQFILLKFKLTQFLGLSVTSLPSPQRAHGLLGPNLWVVRSTVILTPRWVSQGPAGSLGTELPLLAPDVE